MREPRVPPQNPVRHRYLDGLRGIACLGVVAYHYIHYFILTQHFYRAYVEHPVIAVLSDGRLSVFLFFIISGFVLTKSSFARPACFGAMLLARALRLWLPTAAAVLIAFAAFYGTAGAAHFDALRDGMLGIVTGYRKSSLIAASWVPPADNPAFSPFWTISIEMIGSALIFALAIARARSRGLYRAVLVIIILALGDNELQLFMAGHLCAMWKKFEATSPRFSALATTGLLLAFSATALRPARLFRSGQDIGLFPVPYDFNLTLALCAIAMFLCIAKSRIVIAVLESRLLQYMGRISFPVYLLHMSVLVSLGAYLTALHMPILIVALSCLAAIILLAELFERRVDAPAMGLSRRLRRRLAATPHPPKTPKRRSPPAPPPRHCRKSLPRPRPRR